MNIRVYLYINPDEHPFSLQNPLMARLSELSDELSMKDVQSAKVFAVNSKLYQTNWRKRRKMNAIQGMNILKLGKS